MIITLITRPRAVPGVGYVGGQVGIWRVWDEYAAKRRSWKNDPINPNGPRIISHEKGDLYMKDCHVNGDFYLRWGRKHAIPALVTTLLYKRMLRTMVDVVLYSMITLLLIIVRTHS